MAQSLLFESQMGDPLEEIRRLPRHDLLEIIQRNHPLDALEARVALLVGEGFSLTQVAERLGLERNRVRSVLERALEVTGHPVDLERALLLPSAKGPAPGRGR